jgi:hypothetical protein
VNRSLPNFTPNGLIESSCLIAARQTGTFCFFCACAELVVVSRQKKTRIIKHDLQPEKRIFGYFFGG